MKFDYALFLRALGLAIIIEGLCWTLFPGGMRRALLHQDGGDKVMAQVLAEVPGDVVSMVALRQRVERKIDNRLRQLHAAQTAELGAIHLVRSPACRVVWMSGALELHSFLDMEPSIRMLERSQAEAVVFLGKVGVGLSAERLLAAGGLAGATPAPGTGGVRPATRENA